MTPTDRANFRQAIEGDWFTSHLLRLMFKADTENMTKLALVYPDEARAALTWRFGFIPPVFQASGSAIGSEPDPIILMQVKSGGRTQED